MSEIPWRRVSEERWEQVQRDLTNETLRANRAVAALAAEQQAHAETQAEYDRVLGSAEHQFHEDQMKLTTQAEQIKAQAEQIALFRKAIDDAVMTLADMHDGSPECSFNGGEGCFACDLQVDLNTALATQPAESARGSEPPAHKYALYDMGLALSQATLALLTVAGWGGYEDDPYVQKTLSDTDAVRKKVGLDLETISAEITKLDAELFPPPPSRPARDGETTT